MFANTAKTNSGTTPMKNHRVQRKDNMLYCNPILTIEIRELWVSNRLAYLSVRHK